MAASLQNLRSDLLDEKCNRETFELKGHELRIREMTVSEYRTFSTLDDVGDPGEFMKLIFPCVTTPDGQQVFDETHLDSLMAQPHSSETVNTLQYQFMVVNGFIAGDRDGDRTVIEKNAVRAAIAGAESADEAVDKIGELVATSEPEPDEGDGDEGN